MSVFEKKFFGRSGSLFYIKLIPPAAPTIANDCNRFHLVLCPTDNHGVGLNHRMYNACIEHQPCVLLRIESCDNPEGTALWERRNDTIDCTEDIPHNFTLVSERLY